MDSWPQEPQKMSFCLGEEYLNYLNGMRTFEYFHISVKKEFYMSF